MRLGAYIDSGTSQNLVEWTYPDLLFDKLSYLEIPILKQSQNICPNGCVRYFLIFRQMKAVIKI